MGRSPCCEKVGLKKGPWTPEEDQKLLAYVEKHGHGSWRALPAKAGLQRCGKSCRLRWTNYLRPDIKRGEFSMQEEQTIIQLHALLGNRWSAIATHLPKRTDNEIKNFWNTHLKKRLAKMGIDPCTHKTKSEALSSAHGHPRSAANLSHMAQWESARLEAEARLVRESKLRAAAAAAAAAAVAASASTLLQGPSSPSPPGCLDVLRAWPANPPAAQGEKLDLESPTSTSSFVETQLPGAGAGLADGSAATVSYQGGETLEASAPWLPEAYTVPGRCAWGQFGAGFTGVLLGGKSSDYSCGDSSENDHEACVREEEEEQGEENNYWNSFLNSFYSSSSSTSPPLFYN